MEKELNTIIPIEVLEQQLSERKDSIDTNIIVCGSPK